MWYHFWLFWTWKKTVFLKESQTVGAENFYIEQPFAVPEDILSDVEQFENRYSYNGKTSISLGEAGAIQ